MMETENEIRGKDPKDVFSSKRNRANHYYDRLMKNLLMNVWLLAVILKVCTDEFSGYSIRYIVSHLRRWLKSIHGLEGDMTAGENTEDISIDNGDIRLDRVFYIPIPRKKGRKKEWIAVNVEIQLDGRFSYRLEDRGEYYVSRIMSSQRGTVFTGMEYQRIRKTYSIWLVINPTRKYKGRIRALGTSAEEIYGPNDMTLYNPDKRKIVIAGLDPASENRLLAIFGILTDMSKTEKERFDIIKDKFKIVLDESLVRETDDMRDIYGEAIEEGEKRGVKKGEKIGVKKGEKIGVKKGERNKSIEIAKNLLDHQIPIDTIVSSTGLSREEVLRLSAGSI